MEMVLKEFFPKKKTHTFFALGVFERESEREKNITKYSLAVIKYYAHI
jgi:hypothetical protein